MPLTNYIHHNMPEARRYQVCLNGQEFQGLNVKEAWAGEKGVIVLFRNDLNGKLLVDDDGNPITDVRFGRVTFREIPRGELPDLVTRL